MSGSRFCPPADPVASRLLSCLFRIDCPHLDILEQLIRLSLHGPSVLGVSPHRRRLAVGVADAEVVDVDLVQAGLASPEHDPVSRCDARSIAGQPDDPVLPDPGPTLGFGPGDLLTAELIDPLATLEVVR